MVTDVFFQAIFAGISALLTLIPTYSLPDPGNTFSNLVGYMHEADGIVPLQALGGAIAAMVGTLAVLRTADFAVWIYHQFWGGD